MVSVQVVQRDLPNYCPISHLYKVDDEDVYYIVTVKHSDALREIFANQAGTTMQSHVLPGAEVFLSNELGQVVDADGNPENGLTAYASTDVQSFALYVIPSECATTHDDVMTYLGFEVKG